MGFESAELVWIVELLELEQQQIFYSFQFWQHFFITLWKYFFQEICSISH